MQKILIFPLAVIVTLLIASASASTDHNRYVPICYQKHGVLIPMRGSCSGFFICVNGNAIASSCGGFYRFNAQTQHCDHPENVSCDQSPTIDESLDDIEELDSNDPPPIIVPAQYIPKPQSPDEVVSDAAAGDICHRKHNGALLPKLDSCTHFYVCILQRPYRRTCPPMLHFNAKRRLCQDPVLAGCIPKPINSPITWEFESSEPQCIGVPDGTFLPDKHDCEQFYNCQSEQLLTMKCPYGLHFSLIHQSCQWPTVSKCRIKHSRNIY